MGERVQSEQARRWRRKDWYWQSECGRYRIVRLPLWGRHRAEAWRYYDGKGWMPIRLNLPSTRAAVAVCRQHAEKRLS